MFRQFCLCSLVFRLLRGFAAPFFIYIIKCQNRCCLLTVRRPVSGLGSDSVSRLNLFYIKSLKYLPNLRYIIDRQDKLAFNPFQQFGQLVKISLAECAFTVVVFAVPIRRVKIKKRIDPVIAFYKFGIGQTLYIYVA